MDIEVEIFELKKRIEKLEGLLLKKEDKNITDKKKLSRDKTRYMFNNKVLSKNRLVLAVVLQYVKDNNPDFLMLQQAFDKSLQGSLNVVEKIENAQKIKDCTKRYFVKEAFVLKDGVTVVVCTQWGIFNIIKFIKQANILGYTIEEIKLN